MSADWTLVSHRRLTADEILSAVSAALEADPPVEVTLPLDVMVSPYCPQEAVYFLNRAELQRTLPRLFACEVPL